MANTATLSIKTDPETKAIIQQAADRIGLSVNSFMLMVAKNAAEADEIVIKNTDSGALRSLKRALEYNAEHEPSMDWKELKAHYGV
jgi:uncharacterized protein (DUF1778 family)